MDVTLGHALACSNEYHFRIELGVRRGERILGHHPPSEHHTYIIITNPRTTPPTQDSTKGTKEPQTVLQW